MKLQLKVITILAGLWIVLSLMIYEYSRTVLINNYERLEVDEIQADISRTENSLNHMIDSLKQVNGNWNQRSDTYRFMSNKSKRFINTNLDANTFENAQINLVMFFDKNGKLFYGRHYNLEEHKFQMMPAKLLRAIEAEKSISILKTATASKAGIIKVNDDYVILSALPIINRAHPGNIKGTLIVGFYLNKSHVDNLAKALQLNISLYTLPINKEDIKLNTIFSKLNKEDKNIISSTGHNFIAGYTFLYDINNKPIGILQIEMPRTIYTHALANIKHHAIIEIIIGIILLFTVWILLKKFILNRITSISEQVIQIDSDKKLSQRVELAGNDELTHMADAINSLLTVSESAENQLKHRLHVHSEALDHATVTNKNLESEMEIQRQVEDNLRKDEEMLRKLAYYDDLTGLPNRLFFRELVEKTILRAKRYGSGLAILYIDADKFKEINDTHGHNIGDEFLKNIALKLKNSIKESDISARLSGDEFIVCLIDISDKDQIQTAIERILNELAKPMIIKGININAQFSIGVSRYPQNATELNTLEKQADLAMYQAKKHGGNAYSFHENKETAEPLPTPFQKMNFDDYF